MHEGTQIHAVEADSARGGRRDSLRDVILHVGGKKTKRKAVENCLGHALACLGWKRDCH